MLVRPAATLVFCANPPLPWAVAVVPAAVKSNRPESLAGVSDLISFTLCVFCKFVYVQTILSPSFRVRATFIVVYVVVPGVLSPPPTVQLTGGTNCQPLI